MLSVKELKEGTGRAAATENALGTETEGSTTLGNLH